MASKYTRWNRLSPYAKKVAVTEELKRLSVNRQAVSARLWDERRERWLPTAQVVKGVFSSWHTANISADLNSVEKVQRGWDDEAVAATIAEMGENAAPPAWALRPLTVTASERAEPCEYYDTTKRQMVQTVRRRGGFGHA